MKKKTMMLLTGVMAAGMLALTACGSAEGTGADTGEAETEVIEQPMEETESGLSASQERGEIGTVTDYDSFDALIADLKKDKSAKCAYAKINLSGYEVLLVSRRDDEFLTGPSTLYDDNDNEYIGASCATFYTKPGDKVVCAGTLCSGGSSDPLAIYDGVVYANTHHTLESYFLSADGKALENKDFIQEINKNRKTTFKGSFRDSNTSDPVERKLTEREFSHITDKVYSGLQDIRFNWL